MKIITRYVIKEFIPHFLLGILVFTFILLIDKIFTLTSLIINKGIPIGKVLMLFIYMIPSFLSLTFPMAFLMGTLLTLGTMQEDNEVIALRAGGVPQQKVLTPLIIIAVMFSVFLIHFNHEIAPLAQKRFTKTYYDIVYQRPALKLEENAFTDINNYKIFTKKVNRKTNQLKGIIIYDLSEDSYPVLITAKKGTLKQLNNLLSFDLYSGFIQKKDENNPLHFNQIQFETYSINFAIDKNLSETKDYTRSIVNMTGTQLKKEIKRLKLEKISTAMLQVQYHQRIAIALACLTFVLIGAPLALITPKHNKAIAFGMSIILIFIFYILLSIGISLGDRSIVPAWIALEIPNFVLASIGITFIQKLKKQ